MTRKRDTEVDDSIKTDMRAAMAMRSAGGGANDEGMLKRAEGCTKKDRICTLMRMSTSLKRLTPCVRRETIAL